MIVCKFPSCLPCCFHLVYKHVHICRCGRPHSRSSQALLSSSLGASCGTAGSLFDPSACASADSPASRSTARSLPATACSPPSAAGVCSTPCVLDAAACDAGGAGFRLAGDGERRLVRPRGGDGDRRFGMPGTSGSSRSSRSQRSTSALMSATLLAASMCRATMVLTETCPSRRGMLESVGPADWVGGALPRGAVLALA